MQILSDYWLLQTQYASQFNQTQTQQQKKAAAQYATVEQACSSGDSYSFSAEALALAQQMLNAVRAGNVANDAQNTSEQSASAETRNNAAVRADATEREQEAEGEEASARGTDGGGSSSGEDIQARIASLQSRLQTAISAGDAGMAASLQSQISVLQAQLQQGAA